MPAFPPAPLPAASTSLVGREHDLNAVERLLSRSDVRLVTLTGAPGVGKTRLAIEAARNIAARFSDGCFFVPLAAIESADRVAPAILEHLELRVDGGATTLREFFRTRDCLLLLDNFEHVAEAAPLIAELLAWAPELKVLVTSRVPLRLSGEHEFHVAPLRVPEPDAPASEVELAANPSIALFRARARAAAPAFELTAENAAGLAEVCRRLEGIPLAIELAAARTKLLDVSGLLERLDDRFVALRGGARDLPPRQRTIEAAIAWSFDLLPPEQRRLFSLLAIFVGGWDLDAVDAICGDSSSADAFDALESLVDHSLVFRLSTPGAPRFDMLQMLRDFARPRLDDEYPGGSAEAARRHARYFLELARRTAPALRAGRAGAALARLDPDRDNLRAAISWSLDAGDADLALGLCASLGDYWRMRGLLTDGRAWIDRALRLHGGASADRAKCLCAAGTLARLQGDLSAARRQLVDAARVALDAGEDMTRAEALTELGIATLAMGDAAETERHLTNAWRLWQANGNTWGRLLALHARGRLAVAREDLDAARALRLEAVALAAATGDGEWQARGLIGLGEIARLREDYREARLHFEQAITLYREIQNPVHLALGLRKLAHVALHLGDLTSAMEALVESRDTFRRLEQPAGVAACAIGVGCVRSAEGNDVDAVRLIAASGLLAGDETGILQAADVKDRDDVLARARARLGARGFQEAVDQGRITPLNQLLAVMERGSPSVAAESRGTTRHRTPKLHESLTARELDVLRMLPEGHSYAEIGKRLFISPRTVDAHLRAIYAKLNVRSRHEAAAYAYRHGLVASAAP